MKIHQICATLALAGTFAVVSGCKDFYAVNVNPLYPTSTTLNTLLPVAQVSMASDLGDNVGGLSQYTMGLMQQLYSTRGIGNFAQTGGSFGGPWSDLYTSMLTNNQIIIDQGTKEAQWGYVGVAQLQKAYVFSQMVDLWGDIPYSEALKGAANLAPRFDKDSDIYNGSADGSIQGLFSLIDEALANLAKAPSNATLNDADLIYKGSLDKWARFGRTLKLKLYNQIRKTNSNATVISQVTPLLNSQLIEEGGDLQLAYSTSISPDNRNPGYVIDYNSNPENHIGRYFYEDMKTKNDPRVRYYFFNQLKDNATTTNQDYINGNFVTVRPGSTGQFTSSASTAAVQTLQGLYPIGGRYDDGNGSTGVPTAKGVAPQRLLTYYARKYTEAELQLMVLNNTAAARAALVEALNASFNKVNTIAAVDGSPVMTTAQINGYINRVATPLSNSGPLDRFDRATNNEDRLEVIMYEKYVASFGYGVDVYTDFRRTHHPQIRVSQQAADPSRGLLPDDGGTLSQGIFPYRFYYPTSDLILNPNSPRTQAPLTSRIFWDR
ncbi:SusD/RagB family nutrient-binding outer membrane lipoprotein [Hymenobacter properus]|uniref:SusD/RagB family nutrient-binding outer membrane lipoprotein n=1 Tax=Hymenobacter properus TaxID=2791026 RepID=A0A931FLK3_9BACT|nr:SusD/RagB family nutrient-binding outer membrane lipoprotein [Hymenobacter properus]MBF9142126.1 SusD/RagB family nutrient-binding outer membrane lipoprotein [Hymenobacter properus]MBR7720933.1 SusD/RagB family nutrient-binding outer membrane lipoprotein [Microvirga sp. SRT04]